jgi:protein KTI12
VPHFLAVALDDVVDSRSEKPARAMLFTAVQREMGRDTILIVDALNYIKGFRYQLYCAAREFKLRVCTVGVLLFTGRL